MHVAYPTQQLNLDMKEPAMRIIAMFTVLLVLAGCAVTPSIQEGPDAEITYDGLHRVNNSQLGAVWIKPSIDLSKYNKLLLEGAGIQYRAVDPQNRYKRNAAEFPLDENQKASIKIAVVESLSDEIRKSEYFTIVDAPGKGVLRIKLGLADVVSRTPPQRVPEMIFTSGILVKPCLLLSIATPGQMKFLPALPIDERLNPPRSGQVALQPTLQKCG